MKPLFRKSVACSAGTHCGTCRDRNGGRAWRASLAAIFELPPGGVDFTCPHGKAWNAPAGPVMVPAEELRRAAICKRCPHGRRTPAGTACVLINEHCAAELSRRIMRGGPCPDPHGDRWAGLEKTG